jgi:hypothetical protein
LKPWEISPLIVATIPEPSSPDTGIPFLMSWWLADALREESEAAIAREDARQ